MAVNYPTYMDVFLGEFENDTPSVYTHHGFEAIEYASLFWFYVLNYTVLVGLIILIALGVVAI